MTKYYHMCHVIMKMYSGIVYQYYIFCSIPLNLLQHDTIYVH